MIEQKNIVFVNEQKALNELAELLNQQKTVYFDMEVDNMYHYFNEVSLIQLLVGNTCYIVDAFSDIDVLPVINSLKDPLLVIHGCDFDLRTLFQHYGFVPNKIFDTMIAARLVGLEEFGLGALVSHYFDIKLDKQYQKANWSIRPLKPEMIEYAAVDTYYLPELYTILSNELEKQGRLDWNQQSCEALMKQTQIVKEIDEETIWRIKGSTRLEPRQLQVLKTLWYWRDATAKEKNWPPFKVMNGDVMNDLAHSIPSDPRQKVELEKLPLKTHASFKANLIHVLQEALHTPSNTWPAKKTPGKPRTKPKNPQLIEAMKLARDKIAVKTQLTPSLIINRESLVAIAETGLVSREKMANAANLMKWQQDLLFDAWIELAG